MVDIVREEGHVWPDNNEARVGVLLGLLPTLKGPDFEKARDLCLLLQGKDNGKGPTADLKKYFEEQEARRLQQWRVLAAELEVERTGILAQDRSKLQKQFCNMAKAAMFSPEDVVVLAHVLFGDESDLRLLAGLMMRKRGRERIVAHNFFMGSMQDPSFMAMYGTQLQQMPWPLFPASADLQALNQKLLDEAATGSEIPSVFRKAAPATTALSSPQRRPPQQEGNSRGRRPRSSFSSRYDVSATAVRGGREEPRPEPEKHDDGQNFQ